MQVGAEGCLDLRGDPSAHPLGEHLGSRKLAKLSHGDPAQGERGRIVPKRNQPEGTQGGGLECSRCRRFIASVRRMLGRASRGTDSVRECVGASMGDKARHTTEDQQIGVPA